MGNSRWHVLPAAFMALAAASGCAPDRFGGEGTVSTAAGAPFAIPQAQGCTIRTVADVPFTSTETSLIVEADIAGSRVPLDLDTGANLSVLLYPDSRKSLGLATEEGTGEMILLGHRVVTDLARVPSLGVGGAVMRNLFAFVPREQPDLDRAGTLGVGFLFHFDIEIDPVGQRISLHEVEGCAPGLVPFEGSYATLTMIPTRQRLPVVEVLVDGQPMEALLDTGAAAVAIVASSVARAGLHPVDVPSEVALEAQSGLGKRFGMSLKRFREMQLGTFVWQDPVLPVIDASLPFGDMVIGKNLLLHGRLWISPSTAKVYLAQAPAAS